MLLLALAALTGTAASASARSLQVGIDDDGVLLGGGDAADDAVSDWQKLGVDTVRLQVSWSRVVPDPASDTAPPGFVAADPDSPGYHWGDHRRGGRSPRRRRDRADPHARRPAAAVGLGQPEPRQPAVPPERPGVRGVRRGGGPALRHSRGPLHPLERAEPAVVDPAAGQLQREALLAGLRPHLSRDGQRRIPSHPQRRPRRHRAHRRAGARRRRPQEPQRQHASADVPARTRLPRRQAAPDNDRRLPWLSARARRRARLPPAQHAQPARPALRHGRQRRPREPLAHRAPGRRHAAVGPDPRQHRAAGHLAGRVRLSDQPAGQAAGRVGRPPGPLSAAGGVPGLARSAGPAALAVPVGRREGWRRQALHRLAVGPELRRRPAQARAGALRPPDVAGLRAAARCGGRSAPAASTPSRSRSASRARGPRGNRWPTSPPARMATGRCAPR